jgi:hypothetical protein
VAKPGLKLRPYKPGDADAFTLRGDFEQDRRAMAWDWDAGPPPGRTWALLRGAAVVGLGGGFDHGQGRWEAWAYLSDLPRRDWPRVVHLAARVLELMTAELGARTIEATARADSDGAARVLGRLGFTATGEQVRLRGGLVYNHYLRRR